VVSKQSDVPFTGAETGGKYTIQYVIDEQGLHNAIGLEMVTVKTDKDGKESIAYVRPFEVVKVEGNNYTFKTTFNPLEAGSYKCCARMYPKNDKLPHRQDFCYVKWLEFPI
jgi:starch phosphorylase